jgi:Cupin-like domain
MTHSSKNRRIKLERPSSSAALRSIDDDWRRWIAENLMLEVQRESIVETMAANGFAPAAAADAIDTALRSPHLGGALRLRNRLKKRDWMLAMYRKNSRASSEASVIPRRHKLPREAFFDSYYSANRPVLITGMMDEWPALRKWNLDFFAAEYGDREVEVQIGRDANAAYEIEREKHIGKMRFSDFIAKVRGAGASNDLYITANNQSGNQAALAGLWADIVPISAYLRGDDADAGFLWFGPAGTITPFHHDLTNNFMAQVIGRKRILLSASWDIPLMQNHYHVYSRLDGRTVSAGSVPSLDQPLIIECILNPGELLFIPVGWMHFVEGVDISVTITFTNFIYDNDYASFYSTYHEL